MRFGSTSAESRICLAARTDWPRISVRAFAHAGLTGAHSRSPRPAAAAWALARYPLAGEGGAGERGGARPRRPPRSRSLDPTRCGRSNGWALKTIGALIEMPRLALARRFREAGPGRRARPDARPQAGAADRGAGRSAAARHVAPRGPRLMSKRQPRRSTADPRLVASSSSAISARGGCRSPAIASTEHCRPPRSRRRSQPRAEAPPAAARRQGGALNPDWLRRVRADRRLDRGAGRRAGQPGRGAVGRTRAGAADRPADGQARAGGGAAAAGRRKAIFPNGRAGGSCGIILPTSGRWTARSATERHAPKPCFAWSPSPANGEDCPSACSTGPRRSTSFTRPPKACRGVSFGGARCTTSRASKGRSGSLPNGGASRGRRGCAIITRSRMRPVAVTGSTAKDWSGDGRGGAPGWFIHGLFG